MCSVVMLRDVKNGVSVVLLDGVRKMCRLVLCSMVVYLFVFQVPVL